MDVSDVIPSPTTAGRAAAALIAGTALFQVALAAGAPWGAAAWGGQHPGAISPQLRLASGVGAAGLGSLAVVAASADLLDPIMRRRILRGACAYFAIGTAMNAASRSRVERALWTPVAGLSACLLWRSTQSEPVFAGAPDDIET